MDQRVTIVGAGPARALLAWLLSSRGIDTLLIERQSDFDREFRGEILMPSGLRALESAGVDLSPVDLVEIEEFRGFLNKRKFIELALGDFERPIPSAVSQPSLLEHLVSMAEATGHFELRRGTTVRRIDRAGDGPWILHCRNAEGETTIETPYLIGSDGRGAVTRRELGAKVVSRGVDVDVVWFRMAYPEAWTRPVVQFLGGRGQLMIGAATPGGLLQVGWILIKGTYGELKSRSIDEWVAEMRDHADPELAAHVDAHASTVTRPFLLNSVSDRVIGWARPGALLIGDAAHTMSPVGGQGVNIALRDAIVAANELVPALRSGGDVDAAAARVEEIRAPEIDRIQRMQVVPPKVMMGRTALHEPLRAFVSHVLSTRAGQRLAAINGRVFLDGVTDVELTV